MPVRVGRDIAAGFTSEVLHTFQDLITKTEAGVEPGQLALRTDPTLSVTEIVHGSVAFILEESAPNPQEAASVVKSAKDDAARVIVSTTSENDEDSRLPLSSWMISC